MCEWNVSDLILLQIFPSLLRPSVLDKQTGPQAWPLRLRRTVLRRVGAGVASSLRICDRRIS
jgi:hypothetical protein